MKKFLILIIFITSVFAKTPSIESMISQMLMVGVGGSSSEEKWVKQLQKDIQEDKVGGIILFSKNIENPKKLKEFTNFFKKIKTKYPLFIAIDQEGGKVQRLTKKNGFSVYPSAKVIARDKNLNEAYTIYKKLADELKLYGFNVNFAPVVDLDINPKSPAIGDKERSYSEKEEIIISYANEFINAQNSAGIISVLKHFPGHGSAVSDSHKRLTDVTDTWQYSELKPYYYFSKYEKVNAVMVGHITLKKFDKKYPASLSKNMINGVLREQLKFQGVVFSDDMNMKAISDIYTLKQAVIKAINAGVDVLVFSSYFTQKSSVVKEVRGIILQAVKSGDIDKKTIENSYNRVIRLKNGIN